MHSRLLIATIVLLGAACALGRRGNEAKRVEKDGIVVEKVGQSGKLKLHLPAANASSNEVVFEVDSIIEVEADGTVTANKVMNLASSDFDVSDLASGLFYNASVKASQFDLSATNWPRQSAAKLTVTVTIVEEDGIVTLGDEITTVSRGDVKVDIGITGWSFTTNGAFLDVAYSMKGRKERPEGRKDKRRNTKGADTQSKKGAERVLDLGGGTVTLSEMVEKDGAHELMASGYPKVQDSVFTVRIPKFSTSGGYDPVIKVEASTSSAAIPATASIGLAGLAGLALAIF